MAIGRAAAALSALASTGTLATVNGSAGGGVWPVVWAMAGPRARHRAATARSMAKKAGIQALSGRPWSIAKIRGMSMLAGNHHSPSWWPSSKRRPSIRLQGSISTPARPEEPRVGKEGGRTVRYGGERDQEKKKKD